MALGHGGRRPGAGRKRKSVEEKELSGWAGHHGNAETRRAEVKAAKAPKKRTPVREPIDLAPAEAAIWAELSPFATALGTLTEASSLAFRELCEAVTVKRALLRQVTAEGWTVTTQAGETKAHPLLGRYQGIYQRVEAGLTRFGLSPIGKEMGFGRPPAAPTGTSVEAPADPFAEFDGPAH